MTFRCRDFDCGHEHTESCYKDQRSIQDWNCCKCNGPMYKSENHTPASSYSAGSGMLSLGPAGSAVITDDFDRQLQEKLDVLDDSAIYNSNLAAELAAQKVVNWKQGINDLLDDDGEGMSDPYEVAKDGDDDDNKDKEVGNAQKEEDQELSESNNSSVPS